MSAEEIKFISYHEAVKLVGAIQEEEDVDTPEKRILMVYSLDDKELCWFDFEEVMAAVGKVDAGQKKKQFRITSSIGYLLGFMNCKKGF